MESVIVSVKSGGVGAAMIQQLKGAMETAGAAMSLFITLEEPTGPMKHEAAIAGTYHSEVSGKDYPRLQILTIRGLLEEHRKPDLPLLVLPTYQRAERVEKRLLSRRSCSAPDSARRLLQRKDPRLLSGRPGPGHAATGGRTGRPR